LTAAKVPGRTSDLSGGPGRRSVPEGGDPHGTRVFAAALPRRSAARVHDVGRTMGGLIMATSRRRTSWAVLTAILVFTPGVRPAPAPPAPVTSPPTAKPQASAPHDPLVVLNDDSRALYRRAKEAALARTGPVILVEGDALVLRDCDRRTEARFVPDTYHVL